MNSLSKNLAKPQAHISDIVDGLSFSGDGAFIDDGKLYLNCVFEDVDWGDRLVSNVQFVNCKFGVAKFVGCVFDACLFENVFFEDAVFARCRLSDCSFVDVAGRNFRFDLSVLVSNVWNGVKANVIEINRAQLSMNVWNYIESSELTFQNCELCDHVFSSMVCNSLLFSESDIERVFIGDSSISQCSLQGGGGQMLRFLKSNVHAFVVDRVNLTQFALVDCLMNALVVTHAQLPLMQMQGCQLQQWQLRNCIATSILIDDVFFASWEMMLLELHGGLLNKISIEMLDANDVVWDKINVKDVGLNDVSCRSFVVKNSDFSGLSKQKWRGVDFRKVIFSEKLTDDERQWWDRFECGASIFSS